jgi:hypothetical protein
VTKLNGLETNGMRYINSIRNRQVRLQLSPSAPVSPFRINNLQISIWLFFLIRCKVVAG